MKKKVMTFAILAAFTIAGLSIAEARWGGGPGGKYCNSPKACNTVNECNNPQNCNGPNGQPNCQVEDPALAQFIEETTELRNEMFELRQEYFEAMNQSPPNKEYAAELWNKMFEVRVLLQEKAKEAGLENGFAGKGRNFKRGNQGNSPCGGPGSKNCWKNQEESSPQE